MFVFVRQFPFPLSSGSGAAGKRNFPFCELKKDAKKQTQKITKAFLRFHGALKQAKGMRRAMMMMMLMEIV